MGLASNENLEDYGKQPESPQEGTPQAETESESDEECCGEAPAEANAGRGGS
jgi:hypothetical protein